MTVKQKFDSIDQSQLSDKVKAVLKKIKDKSKNFRDKEASKVLEPSVDKLIAKIKEQKPEAIKKTATRKSTAKKPTARKTTVTKKQRTVKGKKDTAPTPKPKNKPKTQRTGGNEFMKKAKEIRKEGESWKDALARAQKLLEKEKTQAKSRVQTELQKLQELIKSNKVLKGFKNSDLMRDSKRTAKVGGKRISKSGKTYYENRENRMDRLAPNYPKGLPKLKRGGTIQAMGRDAQLLGIPNAEDLVMEKGGKTRSKASWKKDMKYFNKMQDWERRYNKGKNRKGYKEDGGLLEVDGGHIDLSNKEKSEIYKWIQDSPIFTTDIDSNQYNDFDLEKELGKKFNKSPKQVESIIYGWEVSRGYNKNRKHSMAKGGRTKGNEIEFISNRKFKKSFDKLTSTQKKEVQRISKDLGEIRGEMRKANQEKRKEIQRSQNNRIKDVNITEGDEFELRNGDIVVIEELFTENGNENWVRYTRNGDEYENSVKELRMFMNRVNGFSYAKGGKFDKGIKYVKKGTFHKGIDYKIQESVTTKGEKRYTGQIWFLRKPYKAFIMHKSQKSAIDRMKAWLKQIDTVTYVGLRASKTPTPYYLYWSDNQGTYREGFKTEKDAMLFVDTLKLANPKLKYKEVKPESAEAGKLLKSCSADNIVDNSVIDFENYHL